MLNDVYVKGDKMMETEVKNDREIDLSMYKKLGMKTKSSHFIKWYNAGLLNNIDENFIEEIQKYWDSNYNKKVDPSLHVAFASLTGKKDTRVIPGRIMTREILPFLNDYNKSLFYGDKNLYDIVIKAPRSVETILRNIRGKYYDSNYNSIDVKEAISILLSKNIDLIVKPSQTNNGTGIRKIKIEDNNIYLADEIITFEYLEKLYEENFMVQNVIQQHPIMAAPHPSSVNTLRMVTLRWNNKIRYLLAYARFGSENEIRDNVGINGIRLGISDSGVFHNIGIDKDGKMYTHHPTTDFCFANLDPIPNFDSFKQFVIETHKNILHLDFISWDIVVGSDGKPIFLEANFAGSPAFYQLASQKPIFGDLTEEILSFVKKELETKEPLLMKKHRLKIKAKENKKKENQLKRIKQRNKKLIRQNKKIEKEKQILHQKLDDQKKELNLIKRSHKKKVEQLRDKNLAILNSKSYRYTRPLRKLSNWFK